MNGRLQKDKQMKQIPKKRRQIKGCLITKQTAEKKVPKQRRYKKESPITSLTAEMKSHFKADCRNEVTLESRQQK